MSTKSMPLIDTCARHPQTRARARCAQCNMWICEACTVGAQESTFCGPECLQRWQVDRDRDVRGAKNRIPDIRRGVRWTRYGLITLILLLVVHIYRESWEFFYNIDLIGWLLGQ